jgi:hypothetical protein
MGHVFIPVFAGISYFRKAERECSLYTGTTLKLKALFYEI